MSSIILKGTRSLLVLTIVLLTTSGCGTTTWTPYYQDLKPIYEKSYKLTSPLVVAAQDQRPYVLSGDKKEIFYGLTRSLYGIPYSVNGGVSASADIIEYVSLLIEDESSTLGIKRMSIDTAEDGLSAALEESTKSPVLLIQFYEWKTDVPAIGTGLLHYDLRAKVIDQAGEVIAQKNATGKDPMINPDPDSVASGVTGRWYQKVKGDALGKVLLSPDIINAINGLSSTQSKTNAPAISQDDEPAVPEAETPRNSCTTEQFLSMKNAGLNDAQILAACETSN